MAGLFLRYLRFLLFNPKPMNQQEETEITEKGKQKLKGGKAVSARIQEIVAADGSRTLISVIEEKCADCRRRLRFCRFLNPPWGLGRRPLLGLKNGEVRVLYPHETAATGLLPLACACRGIGLSSRHVCESRLD